MELADSRLTETSIRGKLAPPHLWPTAHAYQILRTSHSPDPFVEQFKYNVISSSLLSSELCTPARLSGPPYAPAFSSQPRHQPSLSSPLPELEWTTPLAVTAVLLATGHYILAMCALLGTGAYMQIAHSVDAQPKADMNSVREFPKTLGRATLTPLSQSMDTLNDLVAAGNAWDAVVHDAIALLEGEERR